MTEGTTIYIITEDIGLLPSTATEEQTAILYSESESRGPAVKFPGNDTVLLGSELAQGGIGEIIDNFERGNLNPYGGLLDITSISSTIVQTGDYALRISPDERGSTGIFSLPGDGLPHYPSEGDITEYFFYPTEYGSTGFHIGMDDSLAGYRVSFTNNQEEQLRCAIYETSRRDDTDGKWNIDNLVAGDGQDVPLNTWYKLQTELHPGKIVNRAFKQDGGTGPFDDQIQEVEASISGYNGSGVGFSEFFEYATTYIDNARIVGQV